MLPQNPKIYRVERGSRIVVAKAFIPTWVREKEHAGYCVPLAWIKELQLPPGKELEAWYVWNGMESDSGWLISPAAVLAAGPGDDAMARLRSLMYEATIRQERQRVCRLTCAGLFHSLVSVGGPNLWVAFEATSISLWTDFAFQHHYGNLKLE
jgi:hypothetical protein